MAAGPDAVTIMQALNVQLLETTPVRTQAVGAE